MDDLATLDLPGTVDLKKPRRKSAPRSAASIAHKRSAKGPTVARLDVSRLDSDGVVMLYVNDVLTNNDRYQHTRRGVIESALSKAYKAAVQTAAIRAGYCVPIRVAAIKTGKNKRKASTIFGDKTPQSGLWSLDVLSIWPTERHLPDTTGLAHGDADAPLSMVRDAMQRAGIIDDDMRIVCDHTDAITIPGERRTIARLTRLRDADLAERSDRIAAFLLAENQAASSVAC